MTTKRSKESLATKARREERFLTGLLESPLTFGAAVEALRGRDGLSLTALASRIGISKQYLCDVEKGRRLASTEQAARFARAFKHPPALFVRLALQDDVRASGLKLRVTVEEDAA